MAVSKSGIQWTDSTWNPVTGCSKVSPGCAHCYAETFAKRGLGRFAAAPLVGIREFTDVRCHEEALEQPLHWRKPRRIFVNSMSDLFHEDVPDAFIDRVFAVMALAPQHTFQILTKRAERMRRYMITRAQDPRYWNDAAAKGCGRDIWLSINDLAPVVLSNVWLGVSVENQHFADERIPLLLQTPAAVRFISAEPLLGAIDLRTWRCACGQSYSESAFRAVSRCPKCHLTEGLLWSRWPLDWVIVGGESGAAARPFDLAWARSLIQQCQAGAIPVFVKQLGARPTGSCLPQGCGLEPHDMRFRDRKGGDMEEWPEDLRVREMPPCL